MKHFLRENTGGENLGMKQRLEEVHAKSLVPLIEAEAAKYCKEKAAAL